jgi:hypothetical protein
MTGRRTRYELCPHGTHLRIDGRWAPLAGPCPGCVREASLAPLAKRLKKPVRQVTLADQLGGVPAQGPA